jgi:hypothetical protein
MVVLDAGGRDQMFKGFCGGARTGEPLLGAVGMVPVALHIIGADLAICPTFANSQGVQPAANGDDPERGRAP